MHSCRHGDQVLLNKAAGAMARSKPTDRNEVGMFHGAGKLDSVDVISNKDFSQYIFAECKVGK